MPARSTVAELVAELLGTFLFFIVGAGAVIVNAATGGEVGLIGVALAHGLALAVLATAFGPISGGQFNPAVTVALWLVGKVRTRAGARIIVAQLAGATAAGFVLKLAFGGFDGGDSAYSIGAGGTPMVADGISTATAIGIEAVLTALLAYAVLLTAVDGRAPKMGGLFIGLAVAADILVGGPLTGAAMNPARWFGPALAYGDLSAALVYVVGPILGAAVAALSVRYLFSER
ncbi:MAG: MIP/aquaporin family protein [Candidatus Limnocylindrus sp.]|jgi:MIP family channel proteins